MGWRGCGFRCWSRLRLLNVGLRNRRYGGCRYGKRLHCGGSWCGACGSEVEVAHRAYDEGDDQQDCDDQGNPSQASHPALTSVPIRRRVGRGWWDITFRIRRADASRSSTTTAAANAISARASRGMIIVPVRPLRHTMPLTDCSQGNAPPDYHIILLLPLLLRPISSPRHTCA